MIAYLAKFGKVITTKVIHCTYSEGPLKGLKNGDRSYKVELKANENIGSYHVLYGSKITLRYRGQRQTCARCFETSQNCPGGGVAKKCEAAGGQKVDFSNYILDMWQKINYNPGEVEIASVFDDHGDIEDEQNNHNSNAHT